MSHVAYVPGPHARAPWILKVLVAVDQGLNAMFNGDPDETISSRAARHRDRWWGRLLCRIFDVLDPGHCDRVLGH